MSLPSELKVVDSSTIDLIVTAGPTREWLDPVRFLSNPASGRTGYYLASAGITLFRSVTHISGPGDPRFRHAPGTRLIAVDTTEEMQAAVKAAIGAHTLLIMSAAPADYAADVVATQKIKKSSSDQLTLQLRPTVDILKSISAHNYPNHWRIGFAAETENLADNALEKLERKRLTAICANLVDREERGFGAVENKLLLLWESGRRETIGPFDKERLATELLLRIITGLDAPLMIGRDSCGPAPSSDAGGGACDC